MPKRHVVFFDKIDSTNTYIKNNYETLNHLDVVVSRTQSKGRGRSDHTWMSDKGNLYFSYVLKNVRLDTVFQELTHISVCVTNVLRKHGIEAWIKYPNDIIVQHKKITGILIETQGNQKLDYMVVGVGVNVNSRSFLDLEHKATSMSLETNNLFDLDLLLQEILEEYDKPHTFQDYKNLSMILGKNIRYNNERFVVDEILDDGRLLLRGKKEIYVSPNEITLEEIYK